MVLFILKSWNIVAGSRQCRTKPNVRYHYYLSFVEIIGKYSDSHNDENGDSVKCYLIL